MAASKKTAVPFFVSYGAEDYFLDLDIERARSWKDRAIVRLDGEGRTDYEVVHVCEQHTEEERVIIIDNANKIKGDKALKTYIEEKGSNDLSTVLVVIVRSEKLPELWAKAGAKGRLTKYDKLKTYDTNNEVIKFIDSEFKRAGLRTDVGVVQDFYHYGGTSLHNLANEVRKIALIVPEGDKVTRQHLNMVLSPSVTAEPFQVAEAVTEKNATKAMNTLSTVYKTMGEEANVPITAALMKAVERLLLARRVVDKQGDHEAVAVAVGMNPWVCKINLMPHVRKHEVAALVHHMGRLCKLDVDVKGPARSKRTLVELTVLSIAAG